MSFPQTPSIAALMSAVSGMLKKDSLLSAEVYPRSASAEADCTRLGTETLQYAILTVFSCACNKIRSAVDSNPTTFSFSDT